jgi:exodeoxyribonuclease VII small subunit
MNSFPPEELTFEDSLLDLETAVRDLEEGRLGLEESLARYEQGVRLLKSCYTRLRQAEQRILALTGTDEEGQPILQAFQHEATTPDRPEPPARPRRSPPDAGRVP